MKLLRKNKKSNFNITPIFVIQCPFCKKQKMLKYISLETLYDCESCNKQFNLKPENLTFL